jgi:hypothetical protein
LHSVSRVHPLAQRRQATVKGVTSNSLQSRFRRGYRMHGAGNFRPSLIVCANRCTRRSAVPINSAKHGTRPARAARLSPMPPSRARGGTLEAVADKPELRRRVQGPPGCAGVCQHRVLTRRAHLPSNRGTLMPCSCGVNLNGRGGRLASEAVALTRTQPSTWPSALVAAQRGRGCPPPEASKLTPA